MRTHDAFLEDLRRAVAANLERLRAILPNHYRLTLLARTAMIADADILVTQDTAEEIHAALGRLVAPFRSWHYVAEKLPEPDEEIRGFWVVYHNRKGVFIPGLWVGGFFVSRHAGSRYQPGAKFDDAYAWEPVQPAPEPPPLPEAER